MPKRLTSDEVTIRNLTTINKAFDRRVVAKDKQIARLQIERTEIERERQDELDKWLEGYKPAKADELLLEAGMRVDSGIETVRWNEGEVPNGEQSGDPDLEE
jgi:hypothetical protein